MTSAAPSSLSGSRFLSRKGWSVASHGVPAENFAALIAAKNEWLKISTNVIEQEFNVNIAQFDETNLAPIELAKGITRAFLRYDNSVIAVGRNILRMLRSQVEDQRSMQYCTLPYAIIHWPGDTSEKGPMHKDGYFYIRDFYTTWTPLNENTHEPLLINEYSHIRKGLLSRKLRLPSFAPSGVLVKPHIGLGDFIAWHGNTDHEGLLNTSKEVTVSLVFRFTSSPIMLESTQPCADLEHGKISSGELDVADFSRLTAKIFRQIEEENKNVSLAYTDITALCNSIQSSVESWKLNRVDQHKIAFVLALWAQRMENRRDVKLFYLYACIASAHVLYPVQQVMRNLLNNSPESNAMNFAKWTIRKYPYKQHEFVLHEEIYTKNRNGGNMHVHIPENLPWVKWME